MMPTADTIRHVAEQRLAVVVQRLCRNKHVQWWEHEKFHTQGKQGGGAPPVIKPVECAIGIPGQQIAIGYLTRHNELNGWFLEDLNQKIKLNLKKCVYENNYFTEGCIVVCKGLIDELGEFLVSSLTHPPRNGGDEDEPSLGELFGGSLTREERTLLLELDAEFKTTVNPTSSGLWVVMSDVHLNDSQVIANLKTTLNLFISGDVPIPEAIVLMGNFYSNPLFHTEIQEYREGFNHLTDILIEYSALTACCRVILIPGPTDPSPGGALLPSLPLPASTTNFIQQNVRKKVPTANIILASNPCRVRHFAQELVFTRFDLLTLINGSSGPAGRCLHRPHGKDGRLYSDVGQAPSAEDLQTHIPAFVGGQGHLVPVPIRMGQQSAVMWNLDHTLWLSPTPDLVVVADGTAAQWASFHTFGSSATSSAAWFGNPGTLRLNECLIYNARAESVELLNPDLLAAADEDVENEQSGLGEVPVHTRDPLSEVTPIPVYNHPQPVNGVGNATEVSEVNRQGIEDSPVDLSDEVLQWEYVEEGERGDNDLGVGQGGGLSQDAQGSQDDTQSSSARRSSVRESIPVGGCVDGDEDLEMG
eukprot:GHVN01041712.1.p1 GENE.GHVN01041712.1~~GHVN01041712.1.p1  ORF type:complete len:588 (+),score=143.04 GHVN01041712.1:576-2339(+)